MAESINFEKDKARRVIDSLAAGAPIEDIRNHDDMLMLAGACLFIARSHGPLPYRFQKQDASAMAMEFLPAEFLVSTDEQFLEDTRNAVEFYAQLARMVKDAEYDVSCEPSLKAFVFTEAGKTKVLPVLGFKEHDPGAD